MWPQVSWIAQLNRFITVIFARREEGNTKSSDRSKLRSRFFYCNMETDRAGPDQTRCPRWRRLIIPVAAINAAATWKRYLLAFGQGKGYKASHNPAFSSAPSAASPRSYKVSLACWSSRSLFAAMYATYKHIFRFVLQIGWMKLLPFRTTICKSALQLKTVNSFLTAWAII